MKFVYSAGLVLFRVEEGVVHYLLLQYIGGHWDFPKGKREAGETIEQTALRELKEETGMNATIHRGFCESLSYIFTDFDRQRTQKRVDFLIGETTEQEVVLSDEHIGFVWLRYELAVQKLTYPNAKKILYKAHHTITTLILT